jgi:hypothetical protein
MPRGAMRKDIEIRHYDGLGRLVGSDAGAGYYVLKIVWHRLGNELLRTERFGWLKVAPAQQTELKTWQELWDWVGAIQRSAPAGRLLKRRSRQQSRAKREPRSSRSMLKKSSVP